MRYYKYIDEDNNVTQLEITERYVVGDNVIEITEEEYEQEAEKLEA